MLARAAMPVVFVHNEKISYGSCKLMWLTTGEILPASQMERSRKSATETKRWETIDEKR